jgi:hypothetical protein
MILSKLEAESQLCVRTKFVEYKISYNSHVDDSYMQDL